MLDPKALDQFLNDRITDYSQIGKFAGKKDIAAGKTLDNLAGLTLSLASKDDVRALSYGEVLISETINYRTQKPERAGLFCEQIFGPRKNYECACGKYKRIRYKGVICERCGVEVTTSKVRRQRTGHIELASPVVHIWYLKSVPSRIGLLLDISAKKLEQVVYFAAYVVTDVDETKRGEALRDLEGLYQSAKGDLSKNHQHALGEARLSLESGAITKKAFHEIEVLHEKEIEMFNAEYLKMKELLKALEVSTVISELDYRFLHDRFAHVFSAGTGAEYLRKLLERIDLKAFISENQSELAVAPKSKHKKILQRLKLATSLYKSGQRPEQMILEALQVLPPDLRPMIQLDGGRFASSDLNDLYRRVINRNNRLKKLSELGAPDVILKNEKRMLQESVDMLLNGDVRSNRPGYTTASKKKLKSLSDILKGKQGRFRQNLLGKRVDYSGRSVIVVGPELAINECGLPKSMALTLFKPFVIARLIEKEIVFNVKHAEKFLEDESKEIWDALDDVMDGKYVLLNRAPTLHRLGIQAFRPKLIEGKAIQLHPLCCTAFNADFDGDQMAVHVPLTADAQREAAELMVTSKNLLSPASGEPIVAPSQDMILGCYYLTISKGTEAKKVFASGLDASYAYDAKDLTLHELIRIRINGEIKETTYGRYLFNTILPQGMDYVNEAVNKSVCKKILAKCFDKFGAEETAFLADRIKHIGYRSATLSGVSICQDDMIIPDEKHALVAEGEGKVKEIQKRAWNGYMTENERYLQTIRVWADVKSAIEKQMKKYYSADNHLRLLVDSGARGSWGNLAQLAGMMGLVANPSGKTIELPIKSNIKEGMSTLEYFIATHGGRKGKADTALKTAQSGYLTRRLVDAAQNVLVREADCGTVHYREINRKDTTQFGESFEDLIYGKFLAKDVFNADKKLVLAKGTLVDKANLKIIAESTTDNVCVRSVLTCESSEGVCQHCYGLDLARSELVQIGTPVGVVAAQSIGEPGTQLTMRTFHSGGTAQAGQDITQGLTRVEELFEARSPKYDAQISDIDGVVESIEFEGKESVLTLKAQSTESVEYFLADDSYKVMVKKGDVIEAKSLLAKSGKNRINATRAGRVDKIEANRILVTDLTPEIREYRFSADRNLLVGKGQMVEKGDQLVDGHINLHRLMELTSILKAQIYIVTEIKKMYAAQGQTVSAKHIELMVRQIFSKVRITNAGSSDFFPGDIVDYIDFKKANDKLALDKKPQAIGTRLLLGLTKIGLFTRSWLSSASFQETTRVLVEASVSRKVDPLEGLKENVVIGRLIPTLEYFENNRNVGDYFDSRDMVTDSVAPFAG